MLNNDCKTYTEKEIDDAYREVRRVFIRYIIIMTVFLGLAAGYFILIMSLKAKNSGFSKMGARLIMLPFGIFLMIGMKALANVIMCIICYRKIRKAEKTGMIVPADN